MIKYFIYAVLFVLFECVFYAQTQRCITPNGEIATCKPLASCDVIFNAVLELNDTAIKFAKKSQCGDVEELNVCCGSYAFPVMHIPQTNLLPNRSVCGYESENDRIYGGVLTELAEFPWMALLGYREIATDELKFQCGGTLINNRYVLTAAHCLRINPESGLKLEVVRLGEWKLSTTIDCMGLGNDPECADPVVDLKIETQISHPGYSRKTGHNDIGLIRLERNVDYTDFIQPICLPVFNDVIPTPGTKLSVAGWGITENGVKSDYKLKLVVPIVLNSICEKIFQKRVQITHNQLCVGGEEGKDSCQGDSGGPLMSSYKISKTYESKWYQEGIIAWGVGCGQKGFPGIYTRVSNYMNWILENILEF